MADAGIRLTIEGEKEFRAALAECDTAVKNNQKALKLLTEEYKLNDAGMKDATSGFGSMAEAQEILASKGKVLADSIEVQTEKVGLLDARVQEASETYGEHDKRTEALRGQLYEASAALTKLTAEQEKNRQAMADAENSTAQYDEAVKALEAQLAANQAELKAMGGGLDALKKDYAETQKESGELEKATGILGKAFGQTGKDAEGLQAKEENLRRQNQNLTDQNAKLSDSISKQKDLIDALAGAQETAAKRYGEGSTQAEAYRKKIAEATGQLDAMERELRENEQAIRDNNKALEDGGDSGGSLRDVLGQIEELTGVKIPAGLDKMLGGMDAGALAAGGIVGVFVELEKKLLGIYTETLDWANDVTTKSAELDLSTTEYQQLEYVAAKAGIEVSVFEGALSKVSQKAGDAELAQARLTKQIEEQKEKVRDAWVEWDKIDQRVTDTNWDVWKDDWQAAKKVYDDAGKALSDMEGELAAAMEDFDKYGIALTDVNGQARSSLDILLDLIDAYAELPEGIERTAEMSEIFGKSYKTLNPLVQSGSETIRDWMDEAVKVGAVMDEGTMATNNYAAAQKNVYNMMMDQTKRKAASDWAASGSGIGGAFAYARDMVVGFNDAVKHISDIEPLKILFGWSSDKKWYENLFGFDSSNAGMLINGIKSLFGGAYANGTNYAPGGYALVGERGPEIVDLPRGSKVYPNGEIPAGLAGGTTVNESNVYNISIDASSVEEFDDIVRIARGARVGMRRG